MSNTITFSLRCCLSLLLLNLAATLLGAQEATQVASPAITASAAGVRIVAPGEGQQLRLEVFAASGERRFDSGLTAAGQPLDWSLQDQAGQRLADGTYRLAVTTTDASGQRTTQHQRRLTLTGGEVSLAEEANVSPLANQVVDGDIVFTSPGGPTYARDIRLSDNFGGLRFYGADSLTTTPAGAAIQFFGNASPNFPGQLYLDSGAHNSAALIFRTAPTGGTITERMRVTADGNVGIGTTNSAGARLRVETGAGGPLDAVVGVTSNPSGFGVSGSSSSGIGVYGFSSSDTGVRGESNSGTGVFGSSTNGYAGLFAGRVRVGNIPQLPSVATVCFNPAGDLLQCGASSLRLKTDVRQFIGGLDIVRRLQPISFRWKENGSTDIGLGAEEVAEVAPSFVFTNSKGEVEGVKYERLSMVLINAIKEQQARIEQEQERDRLQQSRIEQLQRQLHQQQAVIENLRKLVCGQDPHAEICK